MTLDFNHRPSMGERINDLVDAALIDERDTETPRTYLGASRLGVPCERALQFEFAQAPKDDGGDFSGQVLRIFEIGHRLEDLAIRWLHAAGIDLVTQKADGRQFGFSVAGGRIRGHVDGIINGSPAALGLRTPALWECKTMNAKNWRACVKEGLILSPSKLTFGQKTAHCFHQPESHTHVAQIEKQNHRPHAPHPHRHRCAGPY